jgi:hypothetical protein
MQADRPARRIDVLACRRIELFALVAKNRRESGFGGVDLRGRTRDTCLYLCQIDWSDFASKSESAFEGPRT